MKEVIKFLDDHFEENKDQILEEFFSYLKFQSISTDPSYKNDVLACATWLHSYLSSCGFTAEQWVLDGHPCIFAEKKVSEDAPTVLLYGHYDVQPVDPLELWHSPPFEPEVRDGEIYARGANDDKGQSYYVMRTLKALHESPHAPKVNIKILIEGEEECGSKTLPLLLTKHREQLKADYLFVVDMGFHSMEEPAITLGCRGMVHMTVEARGSKTDLHSGEHGGIAFNPLHALVEILAKTRSAETGKINIPGFYDRVSSLNEDEKKAFALDLAPGFYKAHFDAEPNGGEKDFSPLESAWLRPTLEINGISGGYAGAGFKTVIPANATAKVSARLVPDQDPKVVAKLIKEFFISQAPEGITITVNDISDNGEPLRTSPDTDIAETTRKAFSEVLGKPCKNILAGGSIPIAALLARTSGAEPVFIGYGLPDDNIHAPNEHFGIDRIKKGMLTIGALLSSIK
jgi:acetylornithine deacetylase/succinyl-diaminopimelate desuccinylase-like protein